MDLHTFLKDQIHLHGPMPLDTFCGWALCHPKGGYYRTCPAIGVKGDFTTAPEVSQMFGELVGVWVLDMWRQMGSPQDIQLIECGPGLGTMMADILRVASQVAPAFLDHIKVSLVEISPVLRQMQKKRLEPWTHAVSCEWFEEFVGASDNTVGPCIILANEFLDALPIKQYQKSSQGWSERCVTWDDKTATFQFVLSRILDCLSSEFGSAGVEDGDIYETSSAREAFCASVMRALSRRGGAFFVCDYGYMGPRCGNSLQALFQGKPSPILDHIGQSDLSAHVDFGLLHRVAQVHQINSVGPVSQDSFLKNMGIVSRLGLLQKNQSPEVRSTLRAQYERLTSPLQMGTLFQVYAAYHGTSLAPCGFGHAYHSAEERLGAYGQ